MSSSFLAKIKSAMSSVNCEAKQEKRTEQFIEKCDTIAAKHFNRENGIVSRQAMAIVAATAIEYNDVLKELDSIKTDVSEIRDKLKQGA